MATAPTSRHYTAEDLERMPDGDRYEIIEGELQERVMSFLSAFIASTLVGLLRNWARASNIDGWVNGADGGFAIFPWAPGDVRMPDVSYVSKSRAKSIPSHGWLTVPPDLAVEVVSPSDSASKVQMKARDYVRAGVPLVWVVFPETRTVEVHRAGASVIEVLTEEDTLTGGEVLPGFATPVSEIFPAADDIEDQAASDAPGPAL